MQGTTDLRDKAEWFPLSSPCAALNLNTFKQPFSKGRRKPIDYWLFNIWLHRSALYSEVANKKNTPEVPLRHRSYCCCIFFVEHDCYIQGNSSCYCNHYLCPFPFEINLLKGEIYTYRRPPLCTPVLGRMDNGVSHLVDIKRFTHFSGGKAAIS